MEFTDYQQQAARTMPGPITYGIPLGQQAGFDEETGFSFAPTKHLRLAISGLGLAGEAGEVVEILKKYIGHGHNLDRGKIQKELGDVLWYVAAIATDLGLDLGEIARANIVKLRERYPDGFNSDRSKLHSY